MNDFICHVGNDEFYFNTAGSVVLCQDWDKKASHALTVAIDAIEPKARLYGYNKMRIYVDSFDDDAGRLLDYIDFKGGIATWTDRRFTEYEWII